MIAMTNLSGAGEATAGRNYVALHTVEPLLGYHLLAIISALVLHKRTESERFGI